LLETVSGKRRFCREVLCSTEISQSELEFVMLLGFSGCIGKIIKMISLYWVMNRGLIELGSKNPGQFGKRD